MVKRTLVYKTEFYSLEYVKMSIGSITTFYISFLISTRIWVEKSCINFAVRYIGISWCVLKLKINTLIFAVRQIIWNIRFYVAIEDRYRIYFLIAIFSNKKIYFEFQHYKIGLTNYYLYCM